MRLTESCLMVIFESVDLRICCLNQLDACKILETTYIFFPFRSLMLLAMNPGVLMEHYLLILHRLLETSKLEQFFLGCFALLQLIQRISFWKILQS